MSAVLYLNSWAGTGGEGGVGVSPRRAGQRALAGVVRNLVSIYELHVMC